MIALIAETNSRGGGWEGLVYAYCEVSTLYKL